MIAKKIYSTNVGDYKHDHKHIMIMIMNMIMFAKHIIMTIAYHCAVLGHLSIQC